MKKIIVALLILSMVILASCGADTEKEPETTDAADITVADETTAVDETTEDPFNDKDNFSEETTEDEAVDEPFLTLPSEYTEVIEDYKNIVEFRLSDNFNSEWNNGNFGIYYKYHNVDIHGDFSNMIVEMLPYDQEATVASYGYVLKDINNDTIPELFWVCGELDSIYSIRAIFTIAEGKAQLLDAFWSRYKCVITDEGELYTMGSGGAAYTEYELRVLDKNSAHLTTTKEFGTDYDHENNLALYYVSEGEKEYISKDRFDELLTDNPYESGSEFLKSNVYHFETDPCYYLCDLSDANLISIKVPELGADKLIYDRVTFYLKETCGLSELELTKSESLSNDFDERFENFDYTEYYIDIEATVKKKSDEIVSITFKGMYNYKTAAHPNHIFFTLNFDPATGERIYFEDQYTVNDEMYEIFVRHAQNAFDSFAGDTGISVENDLCQIDTFMNGIKNEKIVCVYYTDDSIGIKYEVPHAAGDYQTVEIPLSELEELK